MILLAIDPGPEKCGVVCLWDGKILLAEEACLDRVRFLISWQFTHAPDAVACEAITPQKTIGVSTIETCYAIGAIREMCLMRAPIAEFHLVPRRDVIRALCLGRANDAVVRAELESRGWTKGTKKAPGRAYGVAGHAWQALALAVAWVEMQASSAKAPGAFR